MTAWYTNDQQYQGAGPELVVYPLQGQDRTQAGDRQYEGGQRMIHEPSAANPLKHHRASPYGGTLFYIAGESRGVSAPALNGG